MVVIALGLLVVGPRLAKVKQPRATRRTVDRLLVAGGISAVVGRPALSPRRWRPPWSSSCPSTWSSWDACFRRCRLIRRCTGSCSSPLFLAGLTAAMFTTFAVWALLGFGYPASPSLFTANVVAKLLTFATVITTEGDGTPSVAGAAGPT
jgi:hypothetical protein